MARTKRTAKPTIARIPPDGSMQSIVRPNMLRHSCGMKMFCCGCRSILDCETAVETDVLVNGQLAKSYTTCGACFDSTVKPVIERNQKPAVTFDVTDGRTIDWKYVPNR